MAFCKRFFRLMPLFGQSLTKLKGYDRMSYIDFANTLRFKTGGFMIVLKRISLFLISSLFSIALIGAAVAPDHGVLAALDKKGSPIVWNDAPVALEWHKITDAKTFYDLWETLIPTFAESFADQTLMMRDFLLDDTFNVKKEHAEVIEKFYQQETRKRVEAKLKLATEPRGTRVECINHAEQQTLEQNRAKLVSHPEHSSHGGAAIVVIVKNESNDILGFALFKISAEDAAIGSVDLDILAIAPTAHGIGLARPLVFSILTLAPEIKRLYLSTRTWNTKAQAVYKALGLKEFHPTDARVWQVCFEHVVQS